MLRWVATASFSLQKVSASSQPLSSETRLIAQMPEPIAPAPSTPAATKNATLLPPLLVG